tara:strand:+ start:1362 stop:1664 length:303 start_codon:yes stop_codon:yes gene_type:complete
MPFANPEDRKKWWQDRRREIRETIEEAKNVPCADCRGTFHIAAMQFDHVRGEKKFNIGGATANSPSISTLKEEIAKCDVVCANCHSVRTYDRGYFCRHST